MGRQAAAKRPSAYRRALLVSLGVLLLSTAGVFLLVFLSASAIERAGAAVVAGKAQAVEASLKHMLGNLAAEAKDYAVWEETFSFAQEPDPAWAANNLDWLLEGMGLSGVAVLKPDGELIFANGCFAAWPGELQRSLLGQLRSALLAAPNWETAFYSPSEGLLYLLAGSRIVHENDPERQGEYAGFLVLAQALDEEHWAQMARLVGVQKLQLAFEGPAGWQPGAGTPPPYVLWLGQAEQASEAATLGTSAPARLSTRVMDIPLEGYLGPPGLALRYEAALPMAPADVRRLYLVAIIAAGGVLLSTAVGLLGMQELALRPAVRLSKAIAAFGEGGAWEPPRTRWREFAMIAEALSQAVASRLAAEEKERQRAQELRLIFDNLPAFVFSKDREGRYQAANRMLCQLLELPEEAIIGKVDAELFPPAVAAQFQENDRRAMEAGEAIEAEEVVTLGEKRLQVRVVKVPLRDSSGAVSGVLGLALDITRERQLEQALRASQKLELLGQLAGGVAHDFNNVLTTIFTGVEMALKAVPPGSEVHAELLEVKRAADRATQITRQLLLLSRSKVSDRRPLDVNEVLGSLAKMLGRLLGEDIRLNLELAADAPWALADRTQVEQVVLNLALNARDAMPRGGTLTLATAPAEHQGQPFLLLTVRDTGTGIPPEIQERIFEPFFTTKGERGTGLGLNIVQGIVHEHQGQLWFETEPGKGTAFHILLPAASAAPRQEVRALEPAPAGQPQRRELILLVEDEAPVRFLTERVLSKQGYRVVCAANAEEALKLWRSLEERPALLISDVVMPGLSGYELARALQKEQPALRVVLVSGYSEEALASRRVPLDGLQLLSKPYTPASLLQAIREALGQP